MATGSQNRKIMIAAAVAASVMAVASVAAVAVVAAEDAAARAGAPDDNGSGAAAAAAVTGVSSGMVRVLEPEAEADITMPTKVSRPGCERDDACYLPASYTARTGEPITWTNNDSAFHTVTSGTYDEPLELFDSGYMDPYGSYAVSFGEPGSYDYYCTLHPWMQGVITVTVQ